MAPLPTTLLAIALAASLYGAAVLGFGPAGRPGGAFRQGRAAVLASAGVLALAAAWLFVSLGTSDFRFAYVAEHTSLAIPLGYKLSAFWAGQEGSFLLWALVLAGYAVYVSEVTARRAPELSQRALAIMLAVNAFFLLVLVTKANPFRLAVPVPEDGAGLNPLLQNFGMLAHPLTLYLGYVGFTVPFAFAVAHALGRRGPRSGRRPDSTGRGSGSAARRPAAPAAARRSTAQGEAEPSWLELTRSFTVFSWLFLSVGIILGMQWAYVELGWGGYWGWDPVENASLIPWLTGTAFLHSALVQERKGTLAGWNLILVEATFLLTILGTFLTRTGAVSSVHAFAPSGLETYFFPFLALAAALGVYATVRAHSLFRETRPLDALLSREAAVTLAVFLFGALTLVVLWGTLFPLFVRLGGGREVSVGPSFYLRSAVPVAGVTVALLALCQALGWIKTPGRTLARNLAFPAALALAGAVAVSYLVGHTLARADVLAGLAAAGLAGFSGLALLWRDAGARRASTGEGFLRSVAALFEVSPRRYGALLVHLAVACMVAGFAGTAFREEQAFTLQPEQSATVGGYSITFRGLGAEHLPYRVDVAASLEVLHGNRVSLLRPSKQYYANYESPASEVAVLGGLREDIYAVLENWTPDGTVSLRVFREPLVAWIWIGGYLLVAGTLVLAWPRSLGLGKRAGRAGAGRDTASRQAAGRGAARDG